MSDYDDDEKKETSWTRFRPALRYTKEMFEKQLRANTSLRDEYLKTQSEILAFMGKENEGTF